MGGVLFRYLSTMLLQRTLATLAVLVGLYLVAGMGPFDAVTYAATTISTGGFANHDTSIGVYDSPAIEWIIDRYWMKTDKASGIVNDPNDWGKEHGDPRYIVDLVMASRHPARYRLPALQGLDEHQSVVYVGTLNKIAYPGLRLGYLIAPPAVADAFRAAAAGPLFVLSAPDMFGSDLISKIVVRKEAKKLKAENK